MPDNQHPKLRNGLEALPFDHDGQKMLLLRDRLGYSPENLVISPPVVSILAEMDGANSLRDLQASFLRHTGQLVHIEELESIVRTLDEQLFLDNERFRTHSGELIRAFLDSPVRRTYHAEKCYPENPEKLRLLLDSFFRPENGGPGLPDPMRAKSGKMVGLVAPHIDLNAGGTSFAHAYKAMAEAEHPETWIILGTGHDPVENCFAITAKDFDTPLGLVRCNAEVCNELIGSAKHDIRASEYNHRIEHTIEFQALFLSFIQPKARIVPILCSFSHEDWASCKDFVDEFAQSLAKLVFNSNKSIGILTSVDLAHVGPRYGDRYTPNDGTVRDNLRSDASLLGLLEECRAGDFIDRIHRDQNSRKICGVAPLYTLAKAFEGRAHGTTLCHSHSTVSEDNSFVTFASMSFYQRESENAPNLAKS